jgi:hypothetical protein
MLNELGLGHSNTENKSNDSNDTVNDQYNDILARYLRLMSLSLV